MYYSEICKVKWQTECDLPVPYSVMSVQIDFSHEGNKNDETEFSISAYNRKELSDLFEDFCKENHFEKVHILGIRIVRVAENMDKLLEMEETFCKSGL